MILCRSSDASAAVAIKATAFRDDHSAELVTITELCFDRCIFSAGASFRTGERLRLHLAGQGWIEAKVERASEGEVSAIYVTDCGA
jgi:hypothetical protein